MSEAGNAQATDDVLRGPVGILGAGALCAALSCMPMISAVRDVLRVGPIDVAVAIGAFWLVMIAGAIVWRRCGPQSRAYQRFDRIETAFTQLAVLALVFRSGRGDSFFWVPAIAHMMILGGYTSNVRFNIGLLVTLPVLLASAFAVTSNLGAAVLAIVIGAIGLYIYWLALTVARKLAAAEAELGETRLREDRQRIARDIHDGIGADLAALDWRLRGLRGDPAMRAEIDELVARLGHGSAELRTIVWALRTPTRSWTEVVAYLRQRALELCGDTIRCELVDDGDPSGTHAGEVAVDYMRAVLEMVRNAVRHAGARRIRVVLRSAADGLSAIVEDDGRGLPSDVLARDEGGLANLRHRVLRAGGELAASTPPDGGTVLSVRLRTDRPAEVQAALLQ